MGIFGKKNVLVGTTCTPKECKSCKDLNEEIRDLRQVNRLNIEELKADQALALKEKDFEIKHLADERIQKLEEELVVANKKIAVFEKQVEMLDKMVDLNADVIDVKELVTNLINKLPEVKINGNLTAAGGKKE